MESLVNVPDPFATDVDVDLYFFSDPAITVDFENVPLDKMTLVEGKFKEEIKRILDEGEDKFDMGRMETLSKG